MLTVPVAEIAFTLKHVAGMAEGLSRGEYGELSEDLVDAILEEAGKFAGEEIAPLNAAGDTHGAPLEDGKVTMPPGWKDIYRRWCEAGWNGLTGPEEFGGQNLPTLLSVATQEMWNAASMAYGIGPTLTMGAVEALASHFSPACPMRRPEPAACRCSWRRNSCPMAMVLRAVATMSFAAALKKSSAFTARRPAP
jgi:alkylation response protein AidB-like acyl-CoA dehydrogenase